MLGSSLSDFRSHDHSEIRVTRIVCEVIVMIILGYEEIDQRADLGYNGGIV